LVLREFLLGRERKLLKLRKVRDAPPRGCKLKFSRVKGVRREDRCEQGLELIRLARQQRQAPLKNFRHKFTSPR
jgi:hypothetical protein